MKKRRLSVLVAIVIAFAAGFYLGGFTARPSGDPVRQTSTVQSLSLSSVTTKKPSSSGTKKSSSGAYYILNTSTGKFHDPSCGAVKQMNESNKKISYKTRDEIIDDGYDPCGRCHP